jgi:hypothetical protein
MQADVPTVIFLHDDKLTWSGILIHKFWITDPDPYYSIHKKLKKFKKSYIYIMIFYGYLFDNIFFHWEQECLVRIRIQPDP